MSFSRLPTFASPLNYSLSLKPSLETFNCEGTVTISVRVSKATSYLQLHLEELDVKDVQVTLENGDRVNGLKLRYDDKWNWVFVDFPTEISPQVVKLTFIYSFKHLDRLNGFYRSSYKDIDGNNKYLLTTFLCPTYARRVLPCWDEPIYKASFEVTLEVKKGLTSLSNMPVIQVEGTDITTIYTYAPSPVMSTYLLAFAVGEFEYIEKKTTSGIPIRVYTVMGKKEQGSFALELAVKALEWYNEWFDIKYVLPKVDLIAIPDFSMNAMENWGLVSYREVALLIDPKSSSISQKSRVALVVAHELAHFWFGDLVTMDWWTDLWLNEGFATFMEYVFVDHQNPEFQVWLHFLSYELERGFCLDHLHSTHSIEIEITNPNELDEIYDAITYSKGCCVNRMLYDYLGKDVYRAGLVKYLKKFQFKNTVTADLWEALGESSNQDVKTMMSKWTQQAGFPLIQVSEEHYGDKRTITVKQQRFLADGTTDNTIWHVPINVITSSNKEFKFLLTKQQDTFEMDNIKADEYIKVNSNCSGFYRVMYSEDATTKLITHFDNLSTADRFGIASDLFVLANAGKVTVAPFLDLLKTKKTDYVVLAILDRGISALNNVIGHVGDEDLHNKFKKFVLKSFKWIADELGWDKKEGEFALLSTLRSLIFTRLAACGDKNTINKALALFDDYITNGTPLNPDLRFFIFATTVKHRADGVEQVMKILEKREFPEVVRDAIIAVGQTNEAQKLEMVYNSAVINGNVKNQDLAYMFSGTINTKTGQEFYWNFFKKNLKLIVNKFGSVNSNLFIHTLKSTGLLQSSSEFITEFETFCNANFDHDQLKILDRTVKQTIEYVKINNQLRQCIPDVKKYLN
ncbi:unnamed protein product [Bursaphelenchus okinawaensis]|uniref:Aminopeptidase n=1 Tax=Bursaphelenchus okinawaensis TaxID=465554 RepID=A0A811KVS3_9BILA|nr:unnamed protein product [Bursaphelenchus okinawaensis]CAG9112229.1 unnamed protein product [Bursaphelenchus okinawaensis]